MGRWLPAASRITHTPDPGFVLKQQQKRIFTSCYLFGDDFWAFFKNSSRAASSHLGCRVSGVTLRQPCRASSRYTVYFGILWPTRSWSAKWICGTTSTPPVSAFSTQGDKKKPFLPQGSSIPGDVTTLFTNHHSSVGFGQPLNCCRSMQTRSRLNPKISAVISSVVPVSAGNKRTGTVAIPGA